MSSRSRVLCAHVALATLICAAQTAPAAEAARSYLGTPLNPTGGSTATEAPITLPRFDDDSVAIKLDGQLDEAVWRELPAYDHMRVSTPDKGEPAVWQTHTFLFHTERGLYVGAWNEQPRDTHVVRLSGRDTFDTADAYQIIIDSSGNGLYGYWFRVKLGDSLLDGTLLPERRFQSNWDGPWQARTARLENGWTAEMFLPWSMFNMPAVPGKERRMAIEIARFAATRNEVWSWPALPDTKPQFISLFQPVTLDDVAPKQEVSLFPYAASGRSILRGVNDNKVGLDVFWRPSPAFFLSGAVNPDFGQVEADNVVVNLSAFETFFPEKRLFFQENQEVFNTGDYGYGTSTTLLHTRRIGAAVRSRVGSPDFDGTALRAADTAKPVDLLLATKAVGQFGRSRYGILVAAEDDTEMALAGDAEGSVTAPGRNFGVGRYQYENTEGGGRKAIGWLGTVSDHPERRASAHAVDGHYRTATGGLSLDGQVITSDVAGTRGWGGMFNVIGRPKPGAQHFFHLATYDDHLDLNDLGYLRRNGYTRVFYEYWWRHQDYEHIRDTNDWIYVQADANSDGKLTQGVVNLHQGWGFNDNTGLDIDLFYNPPTWDDRNSRGNGAFKLPGALGGNVFWSSPRERAVNVSLGLSVNQASLGGINEGLNSTLSWRPAPSVRIVTGINYSTTANWLVWQGHGNFTSFASEQWSVNLGVGIYFTARQHLELQSQWVAVKASEAGRYLVVPDRYIEEVSRPDGEEEAKLAISDVVIQLRYRWEIAPMSDLFVVYNRSGSLPGGADGAGFTDMLNSAFDNRVEDGVLVKLRYRFGL